MPLFASLRSRVVAVSLLPALVLLLVGLGAGWWLAGQAQQRGTAAAAVGRESAALRTFATAALAERRAATLVGPEQGRAATDAAAAALGAAVADAPPAGLGPSFAQVRAGIAGLASARRAVEGGARGADAASAYVAVLDPSAAALDDMAAGVTQPDAIAGLTGAARVLTAVEGVQGASLAAASAPGRVLDAVSYPPFARAAAGSSAALAQAPAALPAGRAHDELAALVGGPDAQRLGTAFDRALAAGPAPEARGSGTTPGAVSDGDLTAAATLTGQGAGIAFDAAADAAGQEQAAAASALTTTMIAVLALVAVAALCIVLALVTGSRLGRRLEGLRDSAATATERLPALLERIRAGEDIDVDAEVPPSDAGNDQIGEVASLVDDAQRTAVGAAAAEARTRAGANAVFLNIAHRSQAVVHRQLQVLDEAERAEHNSDQLARLFQLDHLATRERRNAENLIIMGGQQPRRQWRKPVPLADIVRSAVAESEQYTRITLGELPDESVDGAAVGDLIHLFAELVDNATSYSPPRCSIDIHGGHVGRGVIVEIVDRGLGIDPEPRERLNRMLANPPDFGLLTLSEDARLGLFVVSRLAHRHGVRVTLRESAYGGVQALVLVPRAVLVEAGPADRDAMAPPASTNGRPEHVQPDGVDAASGLPMRPERLGRDDAGGEDGPADTDAGSSANGRSGRGPGADGVPEGLPDLPSRPAPPAGGNGRPRRAPAGDGGGDSPDAHEDLPVRPRPASGGNGRPRRASADGVPDLPVRPDREPGGDGRSRVPDAGRDGRAGDANDRIDAGAHNADGDGEVSGTTRGGAARSAAEAAAAPGASAPAADPAGPAGTDPARRPVTSAEPETGGPALPPLPEREPQVNLAKELRSRPAAAGPPRPSASPRAERSSAAMSALQRAGRNGRTAEPDPDAREDDA